jgi:uncharacterized protein (DUF1330 family)
MDVNKLVEDFEQNYGDGSDGTAPTADQWRRILERDPSQPLTLINFFKFRADVPDSQDSFSRYAEVSMPTMQRVGGSFLLVSPAAGSMIGPEEDWDLVAIGSYPNLDAFLGLYQDAAYRAAFAHRTAACAHQKVLVAAA